MTADRRVVLTVVCFLGLIALGGLAGVIWLVHDDTKPEALLAVTGIVGPAAGALSALLASTRTQISAGQDAQALNSLVPDPPVPPDAVIEADVNIVAQPAADPQPDA